MPDTPPFVMRLTAISEPFNNGTYVELKFVADANTYPPGGELYLRVPAANAPDWSVGDEFIARLRGVSV